MISTTVTQISKHLYIHYLKYINPIKTEFDRIHELYGIQICLIWNAIISYKVKETSIKTEIILYINSKYEYVVSILPSGNIKMKKIEINLNNIIKIYNNIGCKYICKY